MKTKPALVVEEPRPCGFLRPREHGRGGHMLRYAPPVPGNVERFRSPDR